MQRAMYGAGFGPVQLHFETVSVAVATAGRLIANKQASMGDIVLMIGAGCGTVDVAPVEFIRPSGGRGGDVNFRVIYPTDGSGSGGNRINSSICEWVKGCAQVQQMLGGWEQWKRDLGRTETDLHDRIWNAAESQKKTPPHEKFPEDPYWINVAGAPGAKLPMTNIVLHKNEMQRFCLGQVKEIMEVVKRVLRRGDALKIKSVFLSGGSFDNTIVLAELEKTLLAEHNLPSFHKAEKCKVVDGSLGKHYPDTVEHQLVRDTTFYILRNERPSTVLHAKDKDVVRKETIPDTHTTRLRLLRRATAQGLLRDRLVPIMDTKSQRIIASRKVPLELQQKTCGDARIYDPVLQMWTIDASSDENFYVHAYVYSMTGRDSYEAHSAARGADGELRKGLSEYGIKYYWRIPRSKLEELGFSSIERNGHKVFEFHGMIYPFQHHDCITLEFAIFKRGQAFEEWDNSWKPTDEMDKDELDVYAEIGLANWRKILPNLREQKIVHREEQLLWHPFRSCDVVDEMVSSPSQDATGQGRKRDRDEETSNSANEDRPARPETRKRKKSQPNNDLLQYGADLQKSNPNLEYRRDSVTGLEGAFDRLSATPSECVRQSATIGTELNRVVSQGVGTAGENSQTNRPRPRGRLVRGSRKTRSSQQPDALEPQSEAVPSHEVVQRTPEVARRSRAFMPPMGNGHSGSD